MGWCSGGELADDVWDIILPHLSEEAKPLVAQQLIDVFEGKDCDVMQETQVWEHANIHCPKCNFDEDKVDNCQNCSGYGWVKKEIKLYKSTEPFPGEYIWDGSKNCPDCNEEGCDPCGAVVAEDCICAVIE